MDLQEKAALIRHYFKLTDKKAEKPFAPTKSPEIFNGPAQDLTQEEYLKPEYLLWRKQNGDDKLEFLLHVCRKHDMVAGIEFLLEHPLALNLDNEQMKILLGRLKKAVALYEKLTD